MSYKPGDAYAKEFITSSPTTGAATNADSLPTATANHNGTDDGTFTMTVTNIDAGRYKITGTIPVGYAKGDVLNVSVAATVGGVAGKAVVDTQVLDSKRVGDLNDAAALTDYQQRGVAVTLPANPPSGFLVTASYSTAPGWYTAPITAAAVWDLATTGHTTSGTFGAAMNAAGAAGDPWSTSLPGSYGSGTAGNIVGNNLNATVGSRLATSGYTAPLTTTQVANAVWDEVRSGHSTAGSFGLFLDAAISTRMATFSLPTNFASMAITSGGAVTVGTNSDKTGYTVSSVTDKTGYSLNLGQTGLSPRALDSVADGSLTVGDALVCAIAAAAGKESISGSSYTVMTPSTGTQVRGFTLTLDGSGNPTARA